MGRHISQYPVEMAKEGNGNRPWRGQSLSNGKQWLESC